MTSTARNISEAGDTLSFEGWDLRFLQYLCLANSVPLIFSLRVASAELAKYINKH